MVTDRLMVTVWGRVGPSSFSSDQVSDSEIMNYLRVGVRAVVTMSGCAVLPLGTGIP